MLLRYRQKSVKECLTLFRNAISWVAVTGGEHIYEMVYTNTAPDERGIAKG